MKKVLLLRSKKTSENSPKFIEFAAKIQEKLGADIIVDHSSFDRLLFDMGGQSSTISDVDTGISVSDYDLVIIHVLARSFDEAHAVAAYCKAKNIKCLDNYPASVTGNKLVMSVCFATHQVPTPRTLYGPVDKLAEIMPELGEKAIFKDNNGTKGRLNFLVKTGEELKQTAAQNPDTRFVLQSFIPNSGDMRVITFAGQPILAFDRTAVGDSHLNNTSQGGTSTLLQVTDLSPKIKNISISAAQSVDIDIAGVDIIVDGNTGLPIVLEVNHTPQMATGAFLPEKITAYSAAIKAWLTTNNS